MENISPPQHKSDTLKCFEYFLLIVSLCLLSLRAMYPESPHTATIDINQSLSNQGFSLILSSILFFTAAAWLLSILLSKNTYYRFSGIEWGLALFIISAFISYSVASNKRAALTDLATLAAPMLMAVFLVQILDTKRKIILVLMVIISLGVVNFYQCVEQFSSSNQVMIEQYEKNPEEQLSKLGIEPGTFKHMLYEHRLYSKDIRGFLTTGNSAGSFALLCLFAALACRKKNPDESDNSNSSIAKIVLPLIIILIIVSLLLTHSKGAILAAITSGVMYALYRLFPVFLRRYKVIIFVLILLLVSSAVIFIISYGQNHGKLPGGNSMLVRWQYWSGAVKMYTEKKLTGLGGGNFSNYYTHYKDPEALETVKDPHNFILSLLTQYGPFGTVGFLLAFAIPVITIIFSKKPVTSQQIPDQQGTILRSELILGISIIITLLIFRPILVPSKFEESLLVNIFAVFYIYLMPIIVFAVIWFLMILLKILNQEILLSPAAVGTMICALAGILMANIIDFAIFEPAVLTLFWSVIACIIAAHKTSNTNKYFCVKLPKAVRAVLIIAIIAVISAYCHYILNPPVKAGSAIQKAYRDQTQIHNLLAKAAAEDRLDPEPLNLNGRVFLQHYLTGNRNKVLLEEAVKCFDSAIKRNPADFRNYSKLSQAYDLLAEATDDIEQKKTFLQNALEAGQETINRYPGSGIYNLSFAKVAEKAGDKQKALRHYEKAVEIEDSYREMFKIMYPNSKLFSRLGETNYIFAKEKIKQLSQSD